MKIIQDIRRIEPKNKIAEEKISANETAVEKPRGAGFSFLNLAKVIFCVFLFVCFAGGAFAFSFFSSANEILVSNNDSKAKLSSFTQIKNLILSKDKLLSGEENGRVNILLLGRGGEGHPGGGLTDTIIIISVKPQEKKIAMISIPRDLYVKIPETNYYTRINAIEQFGENRCREQKCLFPAEEGISFVQKTISEIAGIPIHYYVQMDFSGFVEMVDELGGIEIEIEEDINDPRFPGLNYSFDPFYLEKGLHNLNGETALKLVRTRHSKRGDFDRIQRQQKVLKAIKDKAFKGNVIQDIFSFHNILKNLKGSLSTNIYLCEIKRFFDIVENIESYEIINGVLDNNLEDGVLKSGNIRGASLLVPRTGDFSEIQEFCRNIFKHNVDSE
jgi:LCP family protein required for cell wall assembly